MADEILTTESVLDENTRRYYLDAMGIQCWQLLDNESTTEVNKDISPAQAITGEVSWLQLEKDIKRCNQCQRHQSRKQAIVGRGSTTADLMFVLLSPNASDDVSGVICEGDSGDLFTKMLAAINIAVGDVYITSLLKCHSANTQIISADEIQQCNNHLSQQLQLMQPKLIIVLGETAAQCLLQENLPLDDLRVNCNKNKNIHSPLTDKYQFNDVPLFVSYSPDELLQNTENKRKAWSDLQALKKII